MKMEDLKPDKIYTVCPKNKPILTSWQFVGYLNHQPVFRMRVGALEETNCYLGFFEEDVERLREINI